MTSFSIIKGPQRIVCLTEEPTETLYLLGEQDRIVGISGFTVRPPRARKEKPRVAAFTSAKIDKIVALKPDLVIGFSNLQADIAAQLIAEGIAVHIFNHRSVAGIFEMINMLGSIVGARARTDSLIGDLVRGLEAISIKARQLTQSPRVYFEEWDDPLISGIKWVSELIELAGGKDCYSDFSHESSAKNRIIADPQDVIRRAPDIIIGSWCGKRFQPGKLAARPGWSVIPAVQNNRLYEIKSCDILQPGPAALTDGVKQISQLIHQWAANN